MNILPDFEDFLRLLETHQVEYMIVGGYASSEGKILMSRPVIPALSFILIAIGSFTQPLFAQPSLQVRNLRVTFPSDNEVSVVGEMRCNQLMPDGMNSPDSNIEVNIDFPRGNEGFARLPEYFMGHYTGLRHARDPIYGFNGKEHVIVDAKPPFYNGTHLRWKPVLDTTLDNYRDDGNACDKVLTAKSRQSVSFSARGVELKESVERVDPDSADGEQGAGQNSDTSKREKLVRKSGRPSQLEAVDASNALEQKLMAMTGIQRAGVRATPRSAAEFFKAWSVQGMALTALEG